VTGPTATAVLEGTWNGTWGFTQLPDAGTFSMEISPTEGDFSGTIRIDESECVSTGTVTIRLEGERIEIGAVNAEEAITFTGTVSGDRMSGTWDDGGSCPAASRRHLGSRPLLGQPSFRPRGNGDRGGGRADFDPVRRLKSTTELVTVLFTDIVSSAAPPSTRGHASCPWARRARCSSRPRSAKRSRASTSPSPIRGSTS